MNHFSTPDWIDFARQAESTERSVMQKHLDAGCSKCLKTLDIWRKLVQLSNRENRYAPPEWAVRAVQASFALRKALPVSASKLELAMLFFDSNLQPVAAGVRSTAATARQLLYRSGSFCIDMRMQPTPGSDSVVLIGQLLDSNKPDHGMRDVPVSLLCGERTVSHKRTNYVGEFDFGLAALRCLQLVFRISESRVIVVAVPDVGESSN